MKTKIILNKISSILLYLTSAIFMINCTLLYSINNKLYWLWLFLALVALVTGLCTDQFKYKLTKVYSEKKYKIFYIVLLVFSFINPISFILNLIVYLKKCDEEYLGKKYIEKKKEDESNKPFFKRSYTRKSIASLLCIIIFSFLAHLVETTGFSVDVYDFTLTKQMVEDYSEKVGNSVYLIDNDSLEYCVTVFKPEDANKDNQAPTLFVIPGFTRTKETMYQYAIEMSRRGFVCLVIDPGCQGGSSYAGVKHDDDGNVVYNEDGSEATWSPANGASGVYYLVQYVYNNTKDFDFVDRDRFGVFGHSQGALNCIMVAQAFAGTSYETAVIKAAQISGYYAGISGRFASLHCNTLLTYGLYEEGYYQGTFEQVALKFINNVNGEYNNDYRTFEIDKGYGSFEDGTYRKITREHINHCLTMYLDDAIENTINFFNCALGNGKEDGNKQVWQFNEIFKGVCLVFLFMFICNLSKILIDTKFFKAVKGSENEDMKTETVNNVQYVKKQYLFDRIAFWVTTAFTTILACIDYMPLTEIAQSWFVDSANGDGHKALAVKQIVVAWFLPQALTTEDRMAKVETALEAYLQSAGYEIDVVTITITKASGTNAYPDTYTLITQSEAVLFCNWAFSIKTATSSNGFGLLSSRTAKVKISNSDRYVACAIKKNGDIYAFYDGIFTYMSSSEFAAIIL